MNKIIISFSFASNNVVARPFPFWICSSTTKIIFLKKQEREKNGEGNFCDDIVYDRVMEGTFIQRQRRRRR